jgi:hypothetical protein
MYSSNKQTLHKSSFWLVILILLLFVGAKTNKDVFGTISSVETDSYCTSPSVGAGQEQERGCVLILCWLFGALIQNRDDTTDINETAHLS